jgi:streptomycin 6-kinase
MSQSFKNSLPGELVTHVSAICGDRGVAWLDELPKTIRRLERRWDVIVEAPFPGIEFNYVAPASRPNGEQVVVKISPPYERTEIFQEARYLRERSGEGAVGLRDVARAHKAILLERALPGEALFRRFKDDPPACIVPAINLLKNILRPVPDDLKDVELLDNWFSMFQRYKETEFPNDLAARATDLYYSLSKQTDRTFYLHGDFHPGNIVTSGRSRILAIDPKGIVGHIGYDIAVFLNNLFWWQRKNPRVEDFLQDAINKFSDSFEMKQSAVREWAFVYMVIGAWWNFEDMADLYDASVAMADIWRV